MEGIFSKPPPPHPSGNSNKASYISLNFLALKNPHPQEIPIPSVEGVWIFSGTAHLPIYLSVFFSVYFLFLSLIILAGLD